MRNLTNFIVWIDGQQEVFDTFSQAARYWDNRTYRSEKVIPGGIVIQQYNSAGDMTRDGWLVHVHENGTVYINTSLKV